MLQLLLESRTSWPDVVMTVAFLAFLAVIFIFGRW